MRSFSSQATVRSCRHSKSTKRMTVPFAPTAPARPAGPAGPGRARRRFSSSGHERGSSICVRLLADVQAAPRYLDSAQRVVERGGMILRFVNRRWMPVARNILLRSRMAETGTSEHFNSLTIRRAGGECCLTDGHGCLQSGDGSGPSTTLSQSLSLRVWLSSSSSSKSHLPQRATRKRPVGLRRPRTVM
jgi:hypothetical protein